MDSERIKELIHRGEAELVELHKRIHTTLARRNKSAADRNKWKQACAEFHARYNLLAFPGGYAGALDRIKSGDPATMEAAICFLECRPYFFRSGYMFKDILRRCRHAPLSKDQSARLERVEARLLAWKEEKLAKKKKNEL